MNISPGEKETERGKNQVKRATVKITGSYSAQPRLQRQFPVTPKNDGILFPVVVERKRRRIIEEEPGTATLQTSVVSKQTVQTARIVFPLYAYYFRATSQRDTLLFIFSLDLNEAAVSATALQHYTLTI